jgi:CRP-like cAMP-binding protein
MSISILSKNLSDDQCAQLASIAQIIELEDDEILFEAGSVTPTLYAILSGKMAVNKENTLEHVTLHVLKPGDLAGEMGFLDDKPHSVTLRALGKSKLVAIDRDAFEGLIHTDPLLVYQVMKTITLVSHEIVKRMNAQYLQLTNYINNGAMGGGYTSGGMY